TSTSMTSSPGLSSFSALLCRCSPSENFAECSARRRSMRCSSSTARRPTQPNLQQLSTAGEPSCSPQNVDAIPRNHATLRAMKSLFIVAVFVASLTPLPAQQIPTPQDIQAAEMDLLFIQEIKLWKALQAHDLVTFNSLLLPDFIEVEKTIQNREEILANL